MPANFENSAVVTGLEKVSFHSNSKERHMFSHVQWMWPTTFLCPWNFPGKNMGCCSVPQSCLTLCNLMDCSTPAFPVLPQLLEFSQTHVDRVDDAIQPSHPLSPLSPPVLNLSLSGSFPMSQFFASGGQSIEASASVAVLPVTIQFWFPLGLTGLITLQSKRISRVFSNTTVQKHQFFDAQLSL